MSSYPLPEPPSSLGFRSSTNTKDAQSIGITLGQYLPGAPLLSTWIEDYIRVLHCVKGGARFSISADENFPLKRLN